MTEALTDRCPACGFALGFPAWNGDSASDEICPCCFIQFGLDDWRGAADDQKTIYRKWREQWIAEGMPWRSKGRPRPQHWNARDQLATLDSAD
jgi:hypothetical protein